MAKLGFFALITAIIGTLTFASMSSPDAADAPCVHKDFKTEMVKEACVKGGQKEAKKVMQAFNKDKKIKSCNQCHTKLAPGYELKNDALKQFEKLGGKLLADAKSDAKDPKAADPKAADPKAKK